MNSLVLMMLMGSTHDNLFLCYYILNVRDYLNLKDLIIPMWFFQAQFDASDLITLRETVSTKVSDELTERAKEFGIVLDDISLVCIFILYKCLLLFVFKNYNEIMISCLKRLDNHNERNKH